MKTKPTESVSFPIFLTESREEEALMKTEKKSSGPMFITRLFNATLDMCNHCLQFEGGFPFGLQAFLSLGILFVIGFAMTINSTSFASMSFVLQMFIVLLISTIVFDILILFGQMLYVIRRFMRSA